MFHAQVRRAGYPYTIDHLGDHLKRHWLDLGLSLKQAAELLGCRATSVANWEKAPSVAGIPHLPQVVEFLGYDPRPQVEAPKERIRHHRAAQGLFPLVRRFADGGRPRNGVEVGKANSGVKRRVRMEGVWFLGA